jgi:hypothetical protein
VNLSIIEIALFLLCLGGARFGLGRPGLFLMWPIAVIVFPTARVYFGFPLYLYDMIVALMLLEYRRELLAIRWDWKRIPWHYVFIVLILVCGIAWPLVVMPVNVQAVWVVGHALLTFSGFGLAALIFYDSARVRERLWLGYGIAASVLILGAIGLTQFGSPAAAGRVAAFFYRDFSQDAFIHSKFYAEIVARRAAGPYGSPNLLGTVAVLAALAASLLVRQRIIVLAVLAAGTIALLSSVSRQAMIGAILAGIIYFIVSRGREKLGAGVVTLAAAPLLVVAFLASDYSTSVLERFSRWDEGVTQDDNFSARYVDGPIRLATTIGKFPSIFVFGTGPDITKLAGGGVYTGGREAGFVSISYLLFLFQYGIIGLLAGIAMHIEAIRNLRYVPVRVRARVAALLTAVFIFYIADNGPNVSETVTMLCLLAIGICSGSALRASRSWRPAAPSARNWQRGLAPVTAS